MKVLEWYVYENVCLNNIYVFFFWISQEKGQTSRRNTDIPTRLAPWGTSILCRQTKKFI